MGRKKGIQKTNKQGNTPKAKQVSKDFYQLRDECLRRGVLFEDPEFPATDSSLYYSKPPDRKYEWKRPGEIAKDPQFFVEGFSRFDIEQGIVGDCWVLAAIGTLTLNSQLFFRVVPIDQDFQENYAGIFHFKFWQYGKWVEIVIDDRLPTYQGKFVFLRSTEQNEFWCALLEKAYARLHGSYEALALGDISEAMEDFTGGVTESYDLKKSQPDLFNIILKAFERHSLMGCSINPHPEITEQQTPQGLVRGHSYSVTRVTYMDIKTTKAVQKIPLIRLRNPWGKIEWNGPWSDKSPEWESVSEADKKTIGLVVDNDGEFWMSYSDFNKYFDRLEICNLLPDLSVDADDIQESRNLTKWDMHVFEGEWVPGINAGGCRNHIKSFCYNPQYRIKLEKIDEDDENNCTIVVALMQKHRRALRQHGDDFLHIGFAVYHLPNTKSLQTRRLNSKFFKYNASIARSEFQNVREIVCRFSLPPGTYCIVPSTFEPNKEAEFLLRVFCERKHVMGKVADDTGPDSVSPVQDKVHYEFLKLAGRNDGFDRCELVTVLDYVKRYNMSYI